MQNIATITLTNALGTQLSLTNLGATIMSLILKDRSQNPVNVVAGFKNAQNYGDPVYIKDNKCLGASIGRFAGRISGGGFYLNKAFYSIEHKDGVQLHGGTHGLQYRIWELEHKSSGPNPKAVFKIVDKEGVHGFPGTLEVRATYMLTEENQLEVTYTATTTKTTVLNLTNHSYFNLNGGGSILDHRLHLDAKNVLDTNAALIPTGTMRPVANTAYNFNWNTPLGNTVFNGLDTPFVCGDAQVQARLYAPGTGIQMEVQTNQPGLVIYTPDSFNNLALSNVYYSNFPAICFEAQGFPDAPNRPEFPSTTLEPNSTYLNKTIFSFSIQDLD